MPNTERVDCPSSLHISSYPPPLLGRAGLATRKLSANVILVQCRLFETKALLHVRNQTHPICPQA